MQRDYTYDARNQLRSINDSQAGTVALSYDAQGNLTQKTRGSDTTTYTWNARDLLSQVSRNGTVLGRYDFAHRQPMALWSGADGKQLLHADALGSIVGASTETGSLKTEVLYDAWGQPTTREGASANKYAYTAYPPDAETGLYY